MKIKSEFSRRVSVKSIWGTVCQQRLFSPFLWNGGVARIDLYPNKISCIYAPTDVLDTALYPYSSFQTNTVSAPHVECDPHQV